MSRYADQVVDQYGAPIEGVSIYVYDRDENLATLTEDGGGALDNPVTSDEYGNFHFNADDGLYQLQFNYGGKLVRVDERVVVGEGPELPDDVVAALYPGTITTLLGWVSSAVGAVYRTLRSKLLELDLTPEDFGAVAGDFLEDDPQIAVNTIALHNFADALGNGVNGLIDRNYMIDVRNAEENCIAFRQKSNFRLRCSGSIIAAPNTEPYLVDLDGDGAVDDLNPESSLHYALVYFENCSDFVVDGLLVDGNRVGRTERIPEPGGHLVKVIGGARGTFNNLRAINGVADGIYVRALTGSDLSTYPTDMVFNSPWAENCLRNNMTLVSSVRCRVTNGYFNHANGTAPKAGFGVEPSWNGTALAGDNYGNIDLDVDVFVSNNDGFGCYLGGPTGGTVPATMVNSGNVRVRGTGNGEGLLLVSTRCDGIAAVVRGGAHSAPNAAATAGIVWVKTTAKNVTLDVELDDITMSDTSTHYCCYVETTTPRITISRLVVRSSTVAALRFGAADGVVSNVAVYDITATATAAAVIFQGGAKIKASNIDIRRSAIAGIYADAANIVIENWRIEDCTSAVASVRVINTATSLVLRNGTLHQTGGTPAAVGISFGVAPAELTNLQATGGYTVAGATTAVFSGSSPFASTVKSANISPDPYSATATYDPPSLAAGATTTTTFSIPYAAVGDRVVIVPPYDLQGVLWNARVSSSGTVTMRLTNATAGAIDLASGSWVATVLKN